jgi:ribonuclease III
MSVFSLPPFQDESLWRQAMTHSSFTNEQSAATATAGNHNERLEFLGDAILTFVSGAYLYARYPDKTEGELTPIRAALVDQSQLCYFAQALNLDKHLRLGKGADQEGARKSSRLLCSAFEALVGAYFLDTNIQTVEAYVLPMFDTVIEQAWQDINVKSRFQEWAQQNLGTAPDYREVSRHGPDHARTFIVEVWIGDKQYGQGQGRSKKEAEKAAARAALEALKRMLED